MSEQAPADLTAAVSLALGDRPAGPGVVDVQRRPLMRHSSHRLEALDVALEDGSVLALVRKPVGPDSLLPVARSVRPPFLGGAFRELVAYRDVLLGGDFETPVFHGLLIDPEDATLHLLLERVEGVELAVAGELGAWVETATWLGRFHSSLAEHRAVLEGTVLPRLTRASWRRWMQRAVQCGTEGERASIAWLAARHDVVVNRLTALPPTVVHGDFYPSNVIVAPAADGHRIAPVDWELAAVGPGLLDLAALTAGQWRPEQREQLVHAYVDGLGARAVEPADLLACRLQVAVQWLGWTRAWQPPAEHRQDWLADALACAEGLGL